MKHKRQDNTDSTDSPYWPDDATKGPHVKGLTFWEAWVLALPALEPTGSGADPVPLADYVASKAPLRTAERAALAGLLRLLPSRWPRGVRGKAKAPRSDRNEAERREVLRVMAEQRAWLAQHPTTSKGKPRRYVPDDVTTKMIGSGFDVARIKQLLGDKGRLGK